MSRVSSTFECEAASISMTSIDEPSAMATHEAHTPHGFGVGPFSQLSALARMRAVLVLPVPRGPVNRYACATRSSFIAFASVLVTCSCPRISPKVWDLYLRYRERYAMRGHPMRPPCHTPLR